ncbi:MAG TPA: PIG-L family deacetylase [Pyrinomonadaceae bacterium]|nr:PIG-L family deacetylase [Pyrinomonadaceae bacterium]
MKSRSQEPGVRSQARPAARREFRAWLALIVFVLSAFVAPAGDGRAVTRAAEDDRAELYQALLDLQNPWTVMCVAAHPDDEDGATLTVLRRKYGVHTVTVFSTYGEGGQNAVGPELYEELGAIRARETVEASAIQGSEPHFLGLKDFGFSKSADEAFRVWGHDEALRRLVLKIRELRPDVIITNHNTVSGHGHHQATGRLVLEAFDAAADPRRFPEQLKRGKGISVWQVQRLFVRVGAPGAAAGTPALDEASIVSVNRNERDEVRGATYAEQALRALQRHATQGPWPQTVPPNWAAPIRYRLARSAKTAPPLPANAQTFLDGMSLGKLVADRVVPLAARAILPMYVANRYDPVGVLQSLLSLRGNISARGPYAPAEWSRFGLMDWRLKRALAAASGIRAALVPHNDVLIPGTETPVSLKISNEGAAPARIRGINFRGLRPPERADISQILAPGASVTVELLSPTPRAAQINVPRAEHLYDGRLFGRELSATVSVEIDGTIFPVEAATRMDVAPAVEIARVTPSPLVLTPATAAAPDPSAPAEGSGVIMRAGGMPRPEFTLRMVNHQDKPFAGELMVGGRLVSRNTSRPEAITLAPREAREVKADRDGDFFLRDVGTGKSRPSPGAVTFRLVGVKPSGVITERTVGVVWADARVAPGLRVGYVRSFDDTLRDSLAALGVWAKALKVEDVNAGDLSKFDAIIIDNRGYQAHPELVAANRRLLDYVRDGGTLIVFYHRTNEWNPDAEKKRPQLAPYPLTLGNARVTDETAPVQFTEPRHPLLNYPNKITPEDFAGWVQERGLYYPEKWDAHYSAPLSMSDRGEAPLRGGLLAADYGRGRYVYTSMVWYRQLRAGVPGAYRVLANMISYGRREK